MGTDTTPRGMRPPAKPSRGAKTAKAANAGAAPCASDPFGLLIAPEAIVSRMGSSLQLASMRSRVHRPLDKPSPSTRPHWMTESIDEALLRPDPCEFMGEVAGTIESDT